jgi:hypothetical protein
MESQLADLIGLGASTAVAFLKIAAIDEHTIARLTPLV